jgi:hypothetical protein
MGKERGAVNAKAYRDRKRQARLAVDNRTCDYCGNSLRGKIASAKVCSDVCRVMLWRADRERQEGDAGGVRVDGTDIRTQGAEPQAAVKAARAAMVAAHPDKGRIECRTPRENRRLQRSAET